MKGVGVWGGVWGGGGGGGAVTGEEDEFSAAGPALDSSLH